LSFVDFFNPLGLLDIVLIARDQYFVVDARAMKALDSAAVINACNPFSIIHSFSGKLHRSLVVIK